MGSLDRISTILRSNVNAQLDQADDPEQTLNRLIGEMADALGEARAEMGEMSAQQKVVEGDRDRNAALAGEWEAKATAAMRLGSEHLAYEALGRKIDYEKNAKAYATQLQAQAGIVEKLEHDVALLEAKHLGMLGGREALVARHGGGATVAMAEPPALEGQIALIDAADGDRAVERELGELRTRGRSERSDERARWADDGGQRSDGGEAPAERVTAAETEAKGAA